MSVTGSAMHKNHNPVYCPKWLLVLAISWKVQKRLKINLLHT